MASLKLKFLTRSRLWGDVVLPKGERVFVPTTDVLAPGTPVSIEVEAPELTQALVLSAAVQEHRPFDGQLPAGLYVQVDAASVERCRAALGDPKDDAGRATNRPAGSASRVASRVDCELPARFLTGEARNDAVVKSLSLHTLTVRSSAPIPRGAAVSLAVTLPDGGEVLLGAQVLWTREDLTLSGLALTLLDGDTERRLRAVIDALLAQKPAPAAPVHAGLVVVADDDPSILDFTSRVVMKAGHRVARADRGDAALELIRKDKPSLVFLDVLMPGLDGLEVCRAIRQDAALSDLPVVLLSAMGEQRLAEAAQSVGATAWLTKPMRIDAVRALLDAYLGRVAPGRG